MKITIEWNEFISYSSTIDVDENELLDWLDDAEEPTLANVKDFLESTSEDEWFDQCDAERDFTAVLERSLERVTDLSG